MQSNNNNNSPGWKQRLDDFEASPSIDLGASWEKLQRKAPAQKENSKKIFYWLAAASVALVAFLTIHISTKETKKTTAPFIVKADTLKTMIENKALVIESNAVTVKSPVIQDNETITKKEVQVVLKNKPAHEEMHLLVKNPEEPLHTLMIDTSGKPVVAVKAPPKKLKLVHINEIESSGNKKELVQQEGKPYFPLTYQSKQEYSNSSGNNKKGKDNLIRIKLN